MTKEAIDRLREMQTSKIIVERPVILHSFSEYRHSVRSLGLEDFLRWSQPASPEIVREFYASGADSHDDFRPDFYTEVMVRQRKVAISRILIQEVVNLPRWNWIEMTQGEELLNGTLVSIQRILDTICIQNTSWKMQSYNPSTMSLLPRKFLRSALPRFWNTMVVTRMVPGLYEADLDLERAGVVATAMLGLKFDVASCILRQILDRFTKKPRFPLPFGGLITELCRRAGVVFDETPGQLQEPTGGALRDSNLSRFRALRPPIVPPPPPSMKFVYGGPLPVLIARDTDTPDLFPGSDDTDSTSVEDEDVNVD